MIGTMDAKDQEFVRQLALVLVNSSLDIPNTYNRIGLLTIEKHQCWFKNAETITVDISQGRDDVFRESPLKQAGILRRERNGQNVYRYVKL
jgi:hypothetical protein